MNTTIQDFERLIEGAYGQVAVIIRDRDNARIIIRDNSGVTGLTGEALMTKCVAFIDELFPGERTSENASDQ